MTTFDDLMHANPASRKKNREIALVATAAQRHGFTGEPAGVAHALRSRRWISQHALQVVLAAAAKVGSRA